MSSKESKKTEPYTSYIVISANTGGHICGPYRIKSDAERECKRLNDEAERNGYLHFCVPQGYEIKTESGLVLV